LIPDEIPNTPSPSNALEPSIQRAGGSAPTPEPAPAPLQEPSQPVQPKPDETKNKDQRFQQRRFNRRGQQEKPLSTGQRSQQQQGQRRQEQRPPQQQGRLDLSIVIPLFNEEASLKELHQQLRSALQRMNTRYELLFVDDGSTDRSFQVLRDLKRADHRIKIIRFRRNYGKSAALSVGFEKAQGDVVITMDADLQDDPNEIPSLVKRINDGFDLVSGWKRVRKDPITKTVPSRFFNFVTRILTGIKIHDFNCGLKAYKKDVVKTVKVYGELHRYLPVLAHWEGFKVGELVVQHRERKYGKTKFGAGRFWKGFLDLLTVLFTTRYFRRPLHLFGMWGMLAALAGIIIDGWLVVEWFMGTTALGNRPLFLGGILLIIVGIQFISIGLLGEMISKTRQAEESYSIKDYVK
jgi:glycosyltransferase involved in cell wall biosynthesis